MIESGATGEVTVFLHRISSGDSQAVDKLVPPVLHQTRELARHYSNPERPGHTLQPTVPVNEAICVLPAIRPGTGGIARTLSRSVPHHAAHSIHHARRKQARKGSARGQAFELRGQQGLSSEQAEELIALNSVLDRLEPMNPRQRQILELRYFGGLSLEQTAEALGVSDMTVKRDWMPARAWLKGQVRPEAMP